MLPKVSVTLHILRTLVMTRRETVACPVEFITGRGNHSAGRIAVLGPAVRSALIEDGWNVSSLPAGLVVYGRSPD